MDLTELKTTYVTVLKNKPNINSDQTIRSYLSVVNIFCNKNSRIYRMTKTDLMEYMAFIRTEFSDSYYNVNGSALKILFSDVLNQPQKMNWFHAVKSSKRFVDIMTTDEFISMMRSTDQIKHKLLMMLFFTTGIRRSELLGIELTDIKPDRIFIRTAKGGKNRNVQLHKLTKRYMNAYFKKWHPKKYLFEGEPGGQYSASSVFKVVKRASNDRFSPHSYRHAYLTNVIEKVGVFAAMELAGHRSLSSTLIYSHIPQNKLVNMWNPIDVAI